jgi:hypothetical protein
MNEGRTKRRKEEGARWVGGSLEHGILPSFLPSFPFKMKMENAEN